MRAALALCLAAALGCATTPAGERPDRAAWSRLVAPFPVADVDGAPLDHAFLGGFDVPRPQLVDVDEDGDRDLLVQEWPDEVMLFERIDDDGDPRFRWRTDRFGDLEVGEWYRFADVDGDGDPDLLTESRFSLVRILANRDGAFEVAIDTLRTPAGKAIYADRQSIPNVTDLDCDGRLDLLLGRLDGTVTRYEATAVGVAEGVAFEHVTDRFEDIEIVAQLQPSRHGANSLVFVDIDSDGDPDLFWGDFFEPGLLLIENTGSCEEPALRGEPRPFPIGDPMATSGYNAPTFGDTDGDGDLDLVVGVLGGAFNPAVTAAANLYHYERTDDGWRLTTRRLVDQIDVGSESVPAVGDIDGDGDPDLLVANKIDPADNRTSRIYAFVNDGEPGRPAFRAAAPLAVTGEFHYAPALGDLDGDGDQDLVVGTWNEDVVLLESVGTGGEIAFERREGPLVELTRGSHATPALGDIDGDGDLDLAVGESSGEINLYRNEGRPTEPRFVLVAEDYGGIDVGRRSRPAFADLDGDGDLDLVVGGEEGPLLVLENDGSGTFVATGPLPIAAPGLSAPAFGDLDGDGDPDLVLGNRSGGLRYYEHGDP